MMSDSLPTVQELDKHLKKLVEWKRFAVHLPKMDMPTIDTIAKNNCGDCPEQKLATYNTWLRVCPDPSWEHVINALETIDENRLARELKEKLYINSRNSAEQLKPSCPGQPFVEIVSTSSVKLYWEKPKVNSAYVTRYVVSYCTTDDVDTWVDYGKSTTAESIEVQGLNPNETYIFKVKAFVHSGNKFVESKSSKSMKLQEPPGKPIAIAKWESEESQVSEVSIFQTNNAVPDAPGKPQYKSAGCDCIELFWKAPMNEKCIEKYEVVSFKSSSNSEIQHNFCEANYFTVVNLSPDTKYYFTVRAHCANNCVSAFSQPSEVISTLKPLPYILQKPIATDITSTSVRLEWCPNNQEDILKYMILYASNTNKHNFMIKTFSNIPECIVSDLEPNTKYFFKLKAMSKVYEEYGPESTPSDVVTTKPLCPSAPGKPEVVLRKCNSIKLKWSLPEINADIVNHYLIHYKISGDTYKQQENEDRWSSYEAQFHQRQVTLKNLDDSVEYSFRVAAICNDSTSLSEPIHRVRTIYPPPFLPRRPCFTDVTESSICLKWDLDQEPTNRHQISYNVYVKKSRFPKFTHYSAQNKVLTTQAKEAHIHDLIPNTSYVFMIEARNHDYIRRSPTSDAIWTKNTQKFDADKKCIQHAIHDSVELVWKMPSNMHDVSHYKVYYKHPEDLNWEHERTNGNETNLKVDGLRHPTTYLFKVFACSTSNKEVMIYESELVPLKPVGDISKENVTSTFRPHSNDINCTTEISFNYEPLPYILQKPIATNVTSTSVTLEWCPNNQEDVSKCKVTYAAITQTAVKKDFTTKKTSNNIPKFTICELEPNTEYVFTVKPKSRSQNKYGDQSCPSDAIRTEPLFLSPPGKPVATAITNTSVSLKWCPSLSNQEDVSKYIITYAASTQTAVKKDFKTKKTTNSIPEFTVCDLEPDTEYIFTVKPKSRSQNKYGDESDPSDPITTKPVFSSPPGKPVPTNIESNSVSLKWCPVEPDSDVSKYTVSYQTAAMRYDWKTLNEKPNCTVANLEPNTEYVFTVKAKSQSLKKYSIESEPSDPIKTKLLHASPPGKPEVVLSTCNSIELKWSKPKSNANSVNHYLIHYAKNHQNMKRADEWACIQIEFQGTQAKIQNLSSGTEYCFMVTAICDSGHSFSEPIYGIRTKYPSPHPPGKPCHIFVTDRSVHLKWEQGEQDHEHPITYICRVFLVAYKSDHQQFSLLEPLSISTKDLEAQVNDLSPETEYVFQIEAINLDDVGAMGEMSDIISTRREVPGPPSKPYILQVSHDTVKVVWEKPEKAASKVSHYVVYYKKPTDINWNSKQTNGDAETNLEVCGLQHSAQYIFKAIAVTKKGDQSDESKVSEPVALKSALPSAPGKPEGKPLSENHGTIDLTWTKPQEHSKNIECYEISYYEDGQNPSDKKVITTNGVFEQIQISISSNKGYYFYVKAVTDSGETSESSLSDLISNDKSLAEMFLPQCTEINEPNSELQVYLIPTACTYIDNKRKLKKVDIKLTNYKEKQTGHCSSKVLMLVGATGSGKTTLINGMVNYIMRVEYGDHFRYKLVHDTSAQTGSVTKWITAYTIHHEPGFQLPFSLTIVDTPGFGDTEGIERDKQITEQVKHFFSMKEGIDHLDGIGFVCKACNPRLTLTQQCIFKSIFSMFGKDVKDSIFLLCTFCDDKEPAVIKAVEEAKMPSDKFFKFNNRAVLYYASNSLQLARMLWDISVNSYREFFENFETAKSVSLRLTQEVLQERETLELIVTGVQQQINEVMNLINRLKKEIDILEKNKIVIKDNINFAYEVEEAVMVEVKVREGRYANNCLKCNMTCHHPCQDAKDDKNNCIAMKNRGRDIASCKICPGKCHWSQHRNVPFRLITETRVVKKVYSDMKMKYQSAMNENLIVEQVVESLKCEIDTKFEEVFNLIQKANSCTKKLDEIAFCPNDLIDNAEYIEILIDAQYQEKRKGYEERIKYYQILQNRAKTLAQVKGISAKAIQSDKRWWVKFFMDQDFCSGSFI